MAIEQPSRIIKLHGEITQESVSEALVAIRGIQEYDNAIWNKKQFHTRVYEDVVTDDKGEIDIDKETGKPFTTLYEEGIYGEEYVPEPILLFVMSEGGELGSGNALVDEIISSPTPIYTIAEGEVCSMAVNICMVGKKRFIKPRCRVMIHDVSGGIRGKFTEILHYASEITTVQSQFINDLLYFTKVPSKLIDKILKEKLDYYMDSSKAIEYGIFDQFWK